MYYASTRIYVIIHWNINKFNVENISLLVIKFNDLEVLKKF